MEIKVVPHGIDAEKLERIAFILKTVAHPVRLGIISLLESNKELTVTDICETIQTEQSLTSHHLNTMKLKGILNSRKKGRNVFYSLKEKDVTQIIRCLDNCGCNM
ncbi:MAG: metalloregulator ArsR/SmtB family transcription factor [Bacteroidota bacterium]